jgi:hypothetical protein
MMVIMQMATMTTGKDLPSMDRTTMVRSKNMITKMAMMETSTKVLMRKDSSNTLMKMGM